MPFNDEQLAREVAACPKTVVTGIGHEPDNSICDMVADMRCSTPTAAAEAVVPEVSQIERLLDDRSSRMVHGLRARLENAKVRLERLSTRPVFTSPEELLSSRYLQHDALRMRLNHAIPDALTGDMQRYELVSARLKGLSQRMLTPYDNALRLSASRLDDLSPLSVLSRGYSATYDVSGGIVDTVDKVVRDDDIAVRLKDGFIDARVQGTRKLEG